MTVKAFLQRVLIAAMAAVLFGCISDDSGSGNTTEVTTTSTPNVLDQTAPVITLVGDNPLTVMQNTTYLESGATAKDGDSDVDVVITGLVDTSIVGVNTVTYTSTDNAGNTSNTTRTVNVLSPLSKLTLIYDRLPKLNEEFKISVDENIPLSDSGYTWRVIDQPDLSSIQLSDINDGESVLMTPFVAGKYKLAVINSNNEEIETEFSVEKDYPFNPLKLEGYDDTQDLSEVTGAITNQVWIYSLSLSKSEIEGIVSEYSSFTVLGFDEVRGLLVEFDESDLQSEADLKEVKLKSGVDSVNFRIHEGSNFIQGSLKTPDDGSSFDDGGDNWHLEYIGMESAWDVTIGSENFYIGITDGGGSYHTKHEDLTGKFKETINTAYGFTGTHGTAVAGTIGAITDNETGMSGINWITQMIGGKSGYEGLKNLISQDKVLLSNNSWTMTNYLPEDFDPTDTTKASEWGADAISKTTLYRKLTDSYANKLFIWAAGNGIRNGKGNNGHYGVDGRYHNPALHYLSDGTLHKKNNVLFVAAVLQDNRLVYFSEYGKSVDIAAPTKFKATKDDDFGFDDYYESSSYGQNTSGGFSGTSAAAPVVTGVASLIFSLDQELKASDVKSILINSATNHAEARYKAPGDSGENDSNIEELSHFIPILNAGAALEMAKDIKEGKVVKMEHTFTDAFQPEVKIYISSANNKLVTTKFDYILGVKTESVDEAVIYQDIESGNSSGAPVFIRIDPEKDNYSIRGEEGVEFIHEKTGIVSKTQYNYYFDIPRISAFVKDTVTFAAIPNASIEIQSMNTETSLDHPEGSGFSDSDGDVRLYLLPGGSYKAVVKADGYEDFERIIQVHDDARPMFVDIAMTPNQVMDEINPVITLNGSNPARITLNEVYQDAGATAVDDVDGSVDVTINTEGVDISEAGTYRVVFTAEDEAGNTATLTRVVIVEEVTVIVVDETKPVITLVGSNPVRVKLGEVYQDAGATAVDDVDGSVVVTINTEGVDISKAGTYRVVFTAEDEAGNSATLTRVVIVEEASVIVVDETKPVITLVGSNPARVIQNEVYQDAGATAVDDVDGSVDVSIDAGNVNMSTLGSYTVVFTATDSAGNTETTTRQVVVEEADVTSLSYMSSHSDEKLASTDCTSRSWSSWKDAKSELITSLAPSSKMMKSIEGCITVQQLVEFGGFSFSKAVESAVLSKGAEASPFSDAFDPACSQAGNSCAVDSSGTDVDGTLDQQDAFAAYSALIEQNTVSTCKSKYGHYSFIELTTFASTATAEDIAVGQIMNGDASRCLTLLLQSGDLVPGF
jgi:hypothetical protein